MKIQKFAIQKILNNNKTIPTFGKKGSSSSENQFTEEDQYLDTEEIIIDSQQPVQGRKQQLFSRQSQSYNEAQHLISNMGSNSKDSLKDSNFEGIRNRQRQLTAGGRSSEISNQLENSDKNKNLDKSIKSPVRTRQFLEKNKQYIDVTDPDYHNNFAKYIEYQNQNGKVEDKQISNFSGNISICFGLEDNKWEQYFGRIKGPNLLLYQHLFENHPSLIISLYKIKINVHPKFPFIIEAFHKKDCKNMLITTLKPEQVITLLKNTKRSQQIPQPIDVQKWLRQFNYSLLKIDHTIETDDRPERFLGKVFLKIHEVSGLVNLPSTSTVFVKIRSYPYIYKTREQICLQNLKWRQEFVFPFIDLFECIYIEIFSSINQGWIKEDFQEKLLGSVRIPVQDFISRNNDYIIQRKKIKLKESEWRNKQLLKNAKENETLEQIKKNTPPLKLVFSLRNLCGPSSLYAASPANYNEGKNLDQDFSEFVNIMKITMIRFKRMLGNIGLMREWEYYIFYFRYKRFSYLVMIISIFLTLTMDLNNILSYILFLICFLTVLNSPHLNKIEKYRSWIDSYLFEKNPDYLEPQIFISDVWDFIIWKQGMVKVQRIVEEGKDKEEEKLGIFDTLKLMRKQLYKMNQWLLHFSNFYEKIKNLITWKDYKRSVYVTILSGITMLVLWNIPLRFLIILAIIKKFVLGQAKYKLKVQVNQNIAEYTMEYLIRMHYPQKPGQVYEKLLEEPWPGQTVKQILQEELQYHLGIHLDNEFMNDFNKPLKMINALKTCSHKLELQKKAIGHYQKFKNDKLYQQLKKKCKVKDDIDEVVLKIIKNFIFNVPSDLFRIIHPNVI